MGADHRPRTYGALGACLLALLVIGASLPSSSASGQGSLGSSCANPEVLSIDSNNKILQFNKGSHIEMAMGNVPARQAIDMGYVEWYTLPGYIICSTRIQLANGSVVPPTHIYPYATPTPIGGQYNETSDPATFVSVVTGTAARAPVPAGRSCNYGIESSLSQTIAHNGPRPAVSVKLIEVSPTALRLKLTPRKPNLVLCPIADLNLWFTAASGDILRPVIVPVSVKPHGGLTPVVTVPASSYRAGENTDPRAIDVAVYARTVKPRR
jgi:hypothetical protein